MRTGETKLDRIDRLVDETWARIRARQDATYREHHPTVMEFAEKPIAEIQPGTWIYRNNGISIGFLSRDRSVLLSRFGRYEIPSRCFVLVARREATNECPCVDCVAVRWRREVTA